jgi:predicted nucleotidyltransferase
MNTADIGQEERISKIIDILVRFLEPKRIYLFGSRASGTNENYSDFDIAIEGNKKSFRTLRVAREKIDYAMGIYSCDLVELEKINADFRKLVEKEGKLLYGKD